MEIPKIDIGMGKFIKEIYNNTPWYHDFGVLGIQTNFEEKTFSFLQHLQNSLLYFLKKQPKEHALKGIKYVVAQTIKDKHILPMLHKLNGFFDVPQENISLLDLFCADGYYSFYTEKNIGVKKSKGVDSNPKEIKRCNIMKKHLLSRNTQFEIDNVFNTSMSNFNVCYCFGGLYHISNPQDLLCKIYQSGIQYLIIQTVISLENEDEDYFVSPAPHWTWGCRFSYSYFLKMIKNNNFEIIEASRDEVGYNRLVSNGYAFALCKRK